MAGLSMQISSAGSSLQGRGKEPAEEKHGYLFIPMGIYE